MHVYIRMLGSLHGRSRFPRLIRRKRDGAAVVSANEPEKEGKGVDAWRPFCTLPFRCRTLRFSDTRAPPPTQLLKLATVSVLQRQATPEVVLVDVRHGAVVGRELGMDSRTAIAEMPSQRSMGRRKTADTSKTGCLGWSMPRWRVTR
jgi:hypothetical protein